jgi:hypothetical protein
MHMCTCILLLMCELLLQVTSWFTYYCLPRAFSNSLETTLTLAALSYLPRTRSESTVRCGSRYCYYARRNRYIIFPPSPPALTHSLPLTHRISPVHASFSSHSRLSVSSSAPRAPFCGFLAASRCYSCPPIACERFFWKLFLPGTACLEKPYLFSLYVCDSFFSSLEFNAMTQLPSGR